MKFHLRVFQLFLLLLPTQLAYHFWPDFSFIAGIRVDYLSPTIFFTDILLVLVLLLWFFENKRPKSFTWKVVLFVLLNIVFSLSPVSTTFHWLRFVLVFLLYVYVNKNVDDVRKVVLPLCVGIFFTAALSFLQIALGRNLGGLLYFIGERPLGIQQFGVSLMSLGGESFLRPYATFPHPNALAGYAGLVVLFLLSTVKTEKIFHFTTIVLSSLVVIVSYSQAAWVALLISLLFVNKWSPPVNKVFNLFVIFSLALPVCFLFSDFSFIPPNLSVSQRIELSLISGQTILDFPLFGVGLGQFIRAIPFGLSQGVWFLQPVHNIPLLVLSEIGVVGSLALYLYAKRWLMNIDKRYFSLILFVLLTAFFDHYWLTSHQNLFLLSVIFATIKTNDFIRQQ